MQLFQLTPARTRTACNLFIAGLLILTLLDATPFLPHNIRKVTAQPIVKALGNWQSHWALFSPNPDHTNSHLSAKVEYADGTTAEWHAPEWRTQSRVTRFWNHRYHRYLETMIDPGFAEAWPGLTKHIVAELAKSRSERPKRIIVSVQEGLVPDAHFEPWTPLAEPLPLNNHYELYREELP